MLMITYKQALTSVCLRSISLKTCCFLDYDGMKHIMPADQLIKPFDIASLTNKLIYFSFQFRVRLWED